MLEFRTRADATALHARADYCDDARIITDAVRSLYPTAFAVTFDTYEDDDTMDCGPLVDAAGRIILGDVSDAECGPQIEQIVARWSYSEFLTVADASFTSCPRTGRPQILLRAPAAGRPDPDRGDG